MKNEAKDALAVHKKRTLSYKLVDQYHASFVDQKTGKYRAKYLMRRNCPVCHADNFVQMFQKSGGMYVKCKKCTMVYTNPVFRKSALKIYYENLDTKQGDIIQSESPFYREIYGLGLSAISRFKKPSNILDEGCSTGFFLDMARERGWKTYGVELGKIEAEVAKKKGHCVYTKTLDRLHLKTRFDLITLWDVFEHIPDGKKHLAMLRNILAKDGIVFLQIPNSGALAPKIMQEECNMFDGLEHTNLYNAKTIRTVVESCGFKILHLKTVISEIAVLNNYLSYAHPYFGTPDYKNRKGVLGLLDEKFIHKNLLGYKFQIVMAKT